MRTINALNFTPKYDEIEDRIRLSVNYEDLQNRVDLMLTRNFILKLLPIVDEYMFKFYNEDLNILPQQNISTKTEDNTKNQTSKTDGVNLELYKQADELLIEIKFSYIQKNNMSIIRFISKDSEVISQVNSDTFKQIFNMIKSTIPFFSWGISHNI